MEINFKVVRSEQNSNRRIQTYRLDAEPSQTILSCLNQIKWTQDGTLAFRKNCRNTICGSCAMGINGITALACKENVGSFLAPSVPDSADSIPEITIAPMGNMPAIKDLVVDMSSFWDNLQKVDPYVSTKARDLPEREFLQTPQARAQLDQTGNCIMCGACYSECNAVEVNPEFVGPHALAKAYRMVADNRDADTEQRLSKLTQTTQGVWGCTRCYYCNNVCPMGVTPMDKIGKIKSEILSRTDDQASRPIRHRKVLIDLVKEGGWVDERKFGLRVVGNYFRDMQGLIGLGPLGLRMLARRKFPLSFEPSLGTAQVRPLIESVQNLESQTENVGTNTG
ncbi:MAG: succinate dehydrogenase/fumarate reductase iron-sulfur subunit [Hormoscilla sp. GM102CHS1]|nr:succinate dehydrogenase/fumarate reductase iron-sulfur subunit [Hormoscilla sp. GM102CHS1]